MNIKAFGLAAHEAGQGVDRFILEALELRNLQLRGCERCALSCYLGGVGESRVVTSGDDLGEVMCGIDIGVRDFQPLTQ